MWTLEPVNGLVWWSVALGCVGGRDQLERGREGVGHRDTGMAFPVAL